ncbi:ABC transporter ATP-binding protein [Marinicrinis lubricantis]|uniref:ABC transporter ATP-binding protein n=1 Tax=Marinicrinis lubricantis TaxID=2086470 RepID=A0ABW1IUX0_9BACL
MQHVVSMNHVSHVYVTEREASLAVQNIHLQVRDGEFISLVGPSGCGKTTLLSIIAGLIQPTEGTVQIEGKPVKGPHPKIGYMLQQDYLYPWRTIWSNAIIGLELRKQLRPEHEQYVSHLLEEMNLSKARDLYPHQLSGGMRQRVALVRTMATRPDVLLLDEPFSALDYQTKLQLEDLILQTIKNHKKTAILVTHDISEAIAMSDRVIMLGKNPGRIRKEFVVPDPIRNALPFEAREATGFHELFREVWQEFEAMDKEG